MYSTEQTPKFFMENLIISMSPKESRLIKIGAFIHSKCTYVYHTINIVLVLFWIKLHLTRKLL